MGGGRAESDAGPGTQCFPSTGNLCCAQVTQGSVRSLGQHEDGLLYVSYLKNAPCAKVSEPLPDSLYEIPRSELLIRIRLQA